MGMVTALRVDALRAEGLGTPTACAFSLARLFTASWTRTVNFFVLVVRRLYVDFAHSISIGVHAKKNTFFS